MLFFFFQAEDGIRDYKVTGVQTCALPIFINDRGEISGFGTLPNGDQHAFLMIPCGADDTEGCQNAAATATRANVRRTTETTATSTQGSRAFINSVNRMLRPFSRRIPGYRRLAPPAASTK